MRNKIYILLSSVTILILTAILILTFYENHGLKADNLQASAHLEQAAQEHARALEEARNLAQEDLAQKEEYIAGQTAYIEELSTQLKELMEHKDAESPTTSTSPYETDYPNLYPQAEYDRRNGIESDREKKIVYLTFDDGPSDLTPKVLDLLDEYNAKATFFVVYKDSTKYTGYLSEIVDRGHTLALHSYSHNYKKIYASPEAFLEDYDKVNQWVYEETGQRPTLFRFPGGSNNGSKSVLSEIKTEMTRRGYIYYDWNVSSGDGSNSTTTENLIDNVCSNVKYFHFPVVLMHDGAGKKDTLAALPTILENLKNMGYTFEALDETMEPVCF